ncbi:MAG: hypothetical protein JKY08_00470 [Flavobacteriaceae bacterium]|nr:hypothetical protein [Flavobacteriaceae bacterium]
MELTFNVTSLTPPLIIALAIVFTSIVLFIINSTRRKKRTIKNYCLSSNEIDLKDYTQTNVVKAKKTFERGGVQVQKIKTMVLQE